jgi:hypothetical protein
MAEERLLMLRLLLGQWMAQLMSRTYTFLDPAILSGGRGQVVALRGRSGSERVPMPDVRLFFRETVSGIGRLGWMPRDISIKSCSSLAVLP